MKPDPSKCPRCLETSPCVHWEEVDIGIGIQVYAHVWECPAHGCWAVRLWAPRCEEHDDCKACSELAIACERSKPKFVFQEDP